MSKIGPKQYSVKVKAPWWILYHYPFDLKVAFEEILRGYLSRKFRVTVRVFPHSLMCRFTVIFEEEHRHPEAISALVEKVAKRTIIEVTAEKTKKE